MRFPLLPLFFLAVFFRPLHALPATDSCPSAYSDLNFPARVEAVKDHPFYKKDFLDSQIWTRQWQEGGVSYAVNDRTFYAFEPPGFYAKAHLTEHGELLTDFRLETEKGRSKILRGSEAFDAILKTFGNRVETIVGYWQSFGPAKSSNFQQYHNQVYAGWKRPEDDKQVAAALSTWTGKQAKKHGFARVKGVNTDYLFEGASNFWRALVFFGREPR
jgi:hypothetical protein